MAKKQEKTVLKTAHKQGGVVKKEKDSADKKTLKVSDALVSKGSFSKGNKEKSTKSSTSSQKAKEIQLPSNIYKGHINSVKTARHYGFNPYEFEVEKIDITKAKLVKDKSAKHDTSSVLNFDTFLEEKVAIIRNYTEKKMQDMHQPPAICFSGPLKGNSFAEKTKEHIFNLDIIGNGRSIADAVVIETAYIILKEHYASTQLIVELNSIGDKDAFARFSREFTQFFKKRLSDLPTDLRQAFKKDPLCLLNQLTNEALEPFMDEIPKPIDYLTEESRAHFREVLEYLESLGLPYTINDSLLGTRNCSTGTVFQIIGIEEKGKQEKRTILAIGERYNSIARKALGKKEVPAIGAHILVDDKEMKKSDAVIIEEEIKFYFIHLGYEAKLRSLTILEILRTANIPVHQALAKDKITAQLQAAEKLGVPYILLVGQKEALENSVTVRHVETRVQETVHINNLIEYLKKL